MSHVRVRTCDVAGASELYGVTCVTRFMHMCDMTHSHVWHGSFITDMSQKWRTERVCVCACVSRDVWGTSRQVSHDSHEYVWHDSHSFVWHDSHSCIWHDSHSYVWHDSINHSIIARVYSYDYSRVWHEYWYVWGVTHIYIGLCCRIESLLQGSFAKETLEYIITCLFMWLFTCVTWVLVRLGHHTCEGVMSHMWMSHVTHVNESCHTCEWDLSHMWMNHITHVNESCHTCENGCPIAMCAVTHDHNSPHSFTWVWGVTHIYVGLFCRIESF